MKKQTLFLLVLVLGMNVAPTFADTIYIDPSYIGDIKNGAIASPYSSWQDFSFKNGNSYLQKRGTTYTSSTPIDLSNLTGVVISGYGSGNRPKFVYTGTGYYALRINECKNCQLLSFDISTPYDVYAPGANNVVALLALGSGTNFLGGTGNIIDGCHIHGVYQGTGNGGMGIRGGGINLKILNTEVSYCGDDGMYLRDVTNLEVGYCNIHHVNQNYGNINNLGTEAGGDALQMDGKWPNFHIHHCVFDRTDTHTGNKFPLILNSPPGANSSSSGIVEYCEFITRPNANLGWALYVEQGNGIVFRFNKFKGSTGGIRVTGVHSQNALIYGNLFYNCSSGVGVAYVNGSPTNTKVYNNVFYNVSNYHIWVDRTTVESRNNIHLRSSDSGVAIYDFGGGTCTISNNCYGDAATIGKPGSGTNSVIGNPFFVDAVNYNFQLQSGSPCIDAGFNVGLLIDIEGTSIPQGAAPDIGVYEYLPSTGAILIDRNKVKIFPNPSAGIFTVHADLKGVSETAFEIRNLSSHLVLKGFFKSVESVINLTSLPAGIYFLSIGLNNNERITKKIIKT